MGVTTAGGPTLVFDSLETVESILEGFGRRVKIFFKKEAMMCIGCEL